MPRIRSRAVLLALLILALGSAAWSTEPSSIVVNPGAEGSNADVTVKNSSDQLPSDAKARISPKAGADETASSVTTDSKFIGTVSGLESGDSVTFGAKSGTASAYAIAHGTGGTVYVGNDSYVQVSNAVGSSSNITVQLPSGTTATVAPGEIKLFDTH